MNKNRSIRVAAFCLGLMLAGSLQVHAQKVTFRDGTVSLKQAFEKIEASSKYKIAYNDSHLNVSRKVSLNQKETEVLEILATILKDTGYTYKKNGNYIVIVPVEQKPASKVKKVKGVVKDASGEAIIGANVLVKGTATGVITDMNGSFELEVPGNAVLQITYIGYVQQDVAVKNRDQLAVLLKEDTKTLDEVVVVGYGTMKKKDLTGAVASVKMDDTPLSTISTVSHALAGKAAGLQVNTISAQPGGGTMFRIRGAASTGAGNDPLIIVDGFPVSNAGNVSVGYNSDNGTTDNILASINPNDIESIEVLKDASSTAIYGARAGSGVIIITTKRGKEGKPKVTYSGSATVQTMATKYEMLDAQDFMIQSNRWFKEKWMYDNKVGIYGGKNESEAGSAYHPKYSDADIANPVNDTDWYDRITRTGFQTQHNISINGGTEYTKYLISGNFFNQKGIVKNNGMSRYTGRVNLDQKLSKYAKVGINLTVSRNTLDNVPLGAGQNEYASILVSAAQFSPLLSVKDENGDYSLNQQAAYIPNPVSLLEISDQTTKERFLATPFVEIKPINELTLKASFGIDRNYQRREVYMPKTTLYGEKADGRADIGQYDRSDYLLELTANYAKRLGDHNLNALVGYSFQRFTSKYLNAGNQGFLTDAFLFNNLGAGTYEKPWVGSSASKSEMASFFGRVNYTYKDRYLVTATLRADGASNFAKNNRWGYFPSVALGWRFTEENFARSLNLDKVLSNGKLRLSYGQTGNSNIGDKSVTYYGTGYNKVFGNKEYTGVYVSQIGNPDLKWETTTEWNVGLDLGFLNNRFNVTAEYFHKVVSDLLSSRSVLSYNEVGSIAANIGKTQSQGFELTINTKNFDTKDFSWNTDFIFSKTKNEITDLKSHANVLSLISGNGFGREGYPVRGLFSIPFAGLTEDGLPTFINQDGQKTISSFNFQEYEKLDFLKYEGPTDPTITGSFGNILTYKNLKLNVFVTYSFGNVIRLDPVFSNAYSDLDAMPKEFKNRWMKAGDENVTNIPTIVSTRMNQQYAYLNMAYNAYNYSDVRIADGGFIRLKEISLSYDLPAKVINFFRLNKLQLKLQATNLCLLYADSKLNGQDPEFFRSGGVSTPVPKQFTFTVRLGL